MQTDLYNKNTCDNEKLDMDNIKILLKNKHPDAKQQLQLLIEKWPDSVVLKRLNKVYFSPVAMNAGVRQIMENTYVFFNRLQAFRESTRVTKSIPSMLFEFRFNGVKQQTSQMNYRERPTPIEPNGKMIFERKPK